MNEATFLLGLLLLVVLGLAVLLFLLRWLKANLTSVLTKRPSGLIRKVMGEETSARSTLHGDATWMSEAEKNRVFSPKNQGIWLGEHHRMRVQDACQNILLAGMTGSGKGTRHLMQQILRCHSGSMVITDPSGELLQQCGAWLHQSGYQVDVLDFKHFQQSRQFNPMAYCQTPEDLRVLASDLLSHVAGKDPIWSIEGINPTYLAMVALHRLAGNTLDYRLPAALSPEVSGQQHQAQQSYCNLANTLWILEGWGAGGQGVAGFMRYWLDDYFWHKFEGLCANKQGFVQDVLATAKAGLALWSDRRIAHLTAKDTMELHSIRQRKRAIFVVPPDNRAGYYGQLANLFYRTLFDVLYQCEPNNAAVLPVYLHLDEFPFLGEVPDIAGCLNTLRKYQVSISIVIQSLAQLEHIYGRSGAESILNGLATKIFLPGMDADKTARYVETFAGYTTKYDTPYGLERDQAHTVKAPLISAAQARTLASDEAIVINTNHQPAKFRFPAYFHNPELLAMTQLPPIAAITPSTTRAELAFVDLAQYGVPSDPHTATALPF